MFFLFRGCAIFDSHCWYEYFAAMAAIAQAKPVRDHRNMVIFNIKRLVVWMMTCVFLNSYAEVPILWYFFWWYSVPRLYVGKRTSTLGCWMKQYHINLMHFTSAIASNILQPSNGDVLPPEISADFFELLEEKCDISRIRLYVLRIRDYPYISLHSYSFRMWLEPKKS